MLKKHSIATPWFFTYRRHALHEVSPVLGLGLPAVVALLLVIWRSQHPGGGAVEEEARLVVDTGGMNQRGSGHQQAEGGRQRHIDLVRLV